MLVTLLRRFIPVLLLASVWLSAGAEPQHVLKFATLAPSGSTSRGHGGVRGRVPRPHERRVQLRLVRHDVRGGLRYIRGWPGLVAICIMAMAINFMVNPVFALMPILITDHFGGGAFQLGWLNSAWGGGMIAGGLILSVWGGLKSKVVTAMLALIGQGLGFILIGMTPTEAFWLSLAGMAFSGTMNPLVNGPFGALIQEVVAPDIQGRVFTVLGSMTALAAPLGLAIGGPPPHASSP